MTMEEVHIIHTNDLHSHFENWPRVRRFIQKRRGELEKQNQSLILVDLGDFVDRVHPLSEATSGQANIELMNQVSYDGATIGNNEGVGMSKAALNQLYNEANFDIILGNLKNLDTNETPEWTSSYKIIETKQGTKVGLLALTAPFPLTYKPNGWQIQSAEEVLPQLIQELQPKCDVLVLMSHLGLEMEIKIAQDYPEIAVILGSHTHHLLEHGQLVGDTLLAAAGKFGCYIGEVTLQFKDYQLISKKAKVIATEQLSEIAQDNIEIEGYAMQGHRLLAQQAIAELPFPLSTNLKEKQPLIMAALQAIKKRADVTIAVLNTGLFLTDLPAGILNLDQLHETLPHPMHLIRVTLSGSNLKRFVLEMEKNRGFLRNFPIVGMGFRGKIFGEIIYDGLTYQQETKAILYQGKEVDETGSYQIVTVDHYLFVPFFPTLELAGQTEVLFPEFLRTVLAEYLHAHYPIGGKKDIIEKKE